MSSETYTGIAIGSILTLVTSIIIIVLTNYFSERQRLRERQSEIKQKISEQVYSPLFFYLLDILEPIGNLMGYFLHATDDKLENSDSKKVINRIKDWRAELNCKFIKKLLENNLGSINPRNFRHDILYMFQFLSTLEQKLSEIEEDDFKDKVLLLQKLRNYCKILDIFLKFIVHLSSFLDNQLFNEDLEISKVKYKSFLSSKETFGQLTLLLKNPEDKALEEKLSQKIAELEKDISRNQS